MTSIIDNNENNNCIIQYDNKNMIIVSIKNIIILLENIVDAFKKILEIINNFQKLILKFSEEEFNTINNISSCKIVLLNNIKLIHDNINIIFNIKYNNCQLITCSIDDSILSGYSISYINSLHEINLSNLIVYINSFRIKYSTSGVIKIVEYNDILEPISVNFLGTHFNKIKKCTKRSEFNKILSKCFNNNNKTISYIKIIVLKYIQIVNNLQTIAS